MLRMRISTLILLYAAIVCAAIIAGTVFSTVRTSRTAYSTVTTLSTLGLKRVATIMGGNLLSTERNTARLANNILSLRVSGRPIPAEQAGLLNGFSSVNESIASYDNIFRLLQPAAGSHSIITQEEAWMAETEDSSPGSGSSTTHNVTGAAISMVSCYQSASACFVYHLHNETLVLIPTTYTNDGYDYAGIQIQHGAVPSFYDDHVMMMSSNAFTENQRGVWGPLYRRYAPPRMGLETSLTCNGEPIIYTMAFYQCLILRPLTAIENFINMTSLNIGEGKWTGQLRKHEVKKGMRGENCQEGSDEASSCAGNVDVEERFACEHAVITVIDLRYSAQLAGFGMTPQSELFVQSLHVVNELHENCSVLTSEMREEVLHTLEGSPDEFKSANNGSHFTVEFRKTNISSSALYKTSSGAFYFINEQTPRSTLLGSVERDRIMFIGISCLIGVVVCAASFLVWHGIALPLQRICKSMRVASVTGDCSGFEMANFSVSSTPGRDHRSDDSDEDSEEGPGGTLNGTTGTLASHTEIFASLAEETSTKPSDTSLQKNVESKSKPKETDKPHRYQPNSARNIVTEVCELHEAYGHLCRALTELKAFAPQGALVQMPAADGTAGGFYSSSNSSSSSSFSDSDADTSSSVLDSGDGDGGASSTLAATPTGGRFISKESGDETAGAAVVHGDLSYLARQTAARCHKALSSADDDRYFALHMDSSDTDADVDGEGNHGGDAADDDGHGNDLFGNRVIRGGGSGSPFACSGRRCASSSIDITTHHVIHPGSHRARRRHGHHAAEPAAFASITSSLRGEQSEALTGGGSNRGAATLPRRRSRAQAKAPRTSNSTVQAAVPSTTTKVPITQSYTSGVGESDRAVAKLALSLGLPMLRRETAFKHVSCSVLIFTYAFPVANVETLEMAVRELFDSLIKISIRNYGTIEMLRPDRFVVSFGAHHAHAVDHSQQAARCATEVMRQLPESQRTRVGCLIDAGSFYAGTCGAHSRYTRVLFGERLNRSLALVQHPMCLGRILVTDRVACACTRECLVPVDNIIAYEGTGGSRYAVQLFHLVDRRARLREGVSRRQLRHSVGVFRRAFTLAAGGDYAGGLNALRRQAPYDAAVAIFFADSLATLLRHTPRRPRYCRFQLLGFETLGASVGIAAAAALPSSGGTTGSSRACGSRSLGRHSMLGHSASATNMSAINRGVGGALGECSYLKCDARSIHMDELGSAIQVPEIDFFAATFLCADDTNVEFVQTLSTDHRSTPRCLQSPCGSACLDGKRTVLLEDHHQDPSAAATSNQPAAPSLRRVSYLAAAGSTEALSMHTSASNLAPSEDSAAALPTIIKDARGETWRRMPKPIGTGAFAEVYKALSSNGTVMALKCIQLSSSNVQLADVVSEVNTACKLFNDHIVNYTGWAHVGSYLVIIMDFIAGGSLHAALSAFPRGMPVQLAKRYASDTLKGLAYLHRNGIVHADIKPQNILLSADGACRLGDFGSSVTKANALSCGNDVFNLRGTPQYMSPEVAAGATPTMASDIWSFGVTLYEMLTGTLPWTLAQSPAEVNSDGAAEAPRSSGGALQGLSPVYVVQLIALGRLVPNVESLRAVNANAERLVARCLSTKPEDRPKAEDALYSPFFLANDKSNRWTIDTFAGTHV